MNPLDNTHPPLFTSHSPPPLPLCRLGDRPPLPNRNSSISHGRRRRSGRSDSVRSVWRSLCRPLSPLISPPMRVFAFISLTSPSNIRRNVFASSNVSLIPWMRGAVSQRHQQAQQRDESVSHGSWLLHEPYCCAGTESLVGRTLFRSSDRLYQRRSFRREQCCALLEESLSLPRRRYPQCTQYRAGHQRD